MAQSRSQIQIDAAPAIRNRAKAIAYSQGLTLTEFVLQSLANSGDKQLKALIDKDLEARSQRGRPAK